LRSGPPQPNAYPRSRYTNTPDVVKTWEVSENLSGLVVWHSFVYNLAYDAENHLASVSGAASATFVYDGDGNRVKATFGSATTVYVGNHFEWTGSTSTMKKYYYADGARVAMREGSTLYYILTDHLGSTAITANSDGTAEVGELRYYAYSKTRYTDGTTPTNRRFTGQIEDATIGLYFYNARYYDPALGRFVQADTIVPSPGNPQALNRYAYTVNNP
jgi:RHS repeat-associated protein